MMLSTPNPLRKIIHANPIRIGLNLESPIAVGGLLPVGQPRKSNIDHAIDALRTLSTEIVMKRRDDTAKLCSRLITAMVDPNPTTASKGTVNGKNGTYAARAQPAANQSKLLLTHCLKFQLSQLQRNRVRLPPKLCQL